MGNSIYAKKKSPINVPNKVQNKIDNTEENPKCWYICELKSKTKAGNVVCGPVESRELIILIWIANSCKPDSKYCIAKNKTYITKNPEKFFADDYARVKKDIKELGLADTYENYFFTNYLSRVQTVTITSDEMNFAKQEESQPEEEEKEQTPIPEPEPAPATEPEPAPATEPEPVTEPETEPEQTVAAASETTLVSEQTSTPEPVTSSEPATLSESETSAEPAILSEPEPTAQIVQAPEPQPINEPPAADITQTITETETVPQEIKVENKTPSTVEKKEIQPKTSTEKTSVKTTATKSFVEPTITNEGEYVYNYEDTNSSSSSELLQEIDITELKNELKSQLKDELISEIKNELKTTVPSPATPVQAEPSSTTSSTSQDEGYDSFLFSKLNQDSEAARPSVDTTQTPTPIPLPAVEPLALKNEPVQEPQTQAIEEAPTEAPLITQEEEIKSSFELPINAEGTPAVARYQRENLLDYAPKKSIALPVDEDPDEYQTVTDPNLADAKGVTILMNAAKAGNDWDVRNLIASGADVNKKDRDGWTALMYAVRYQENVQVVEHLIQSGADIKAKNKFEVSALSLAATYNANPEILKKLLNAYSPYEKEMTQAFILMLSDNSTSEASKAAKTEAFIKKSVSLNSFYNGKTPLMYAAQYSTSTLVIKKMLEYGASASIRAADGKTAFDYARQNSSLPHDEIFWALNKK